jgi:hypothetical protein
VGLGEELQEEAGRVAGKLQQPLTCSYILGSALIYRDLRQKSFAPGADFRRMIIMRTFLRGIHSS